MIRSLNEYGRNFDTMSGRNSKRSCRGRKRDSEPEMRATYADDEDSPGRISIFHVS